VIFIDKKITEKNKLKDMKIEDIIKIFAEDKYKLFSQCSGTETMIAILINNYLEKTEEKADTRIVIIPSYKEILDGYFFKK